MYVCQEEIIFTQYSNTEGKTTAGKSLLAELKNVQLQFFIKDKILSIQSITGFISLYLKLSEDGGNIRLIGQIGENLKLQKQKI